MTMLGAHRAGRSAAFSSLETTQTGLAPPLRAYCVGEAAQAAGGAPDQDVVALLHVAAVLGDELAVRRAVAPGRGGGLLPGAGARAWASAGWP